MPVPLSFGLELAAAVAREGPCEHPPEIVKITTVFNETLVIDGDLYRSHSQDISIPRGNNQSNLGCY